MASEGSCSAADRGSEAAACEGGNEVTPDPGKESPSSTKRNETENNPERTLPDQTAAERARSEATETRQGRGRAKLASILMRKKTSMLGLSKAGRTQSDLQAVEKARLAQSMGLDPVVVESIEKCVKIKKPDDKVYSINKHGISKVVRLFSEKPKPKPLTVCFNFPSMALTHLHILKLMRGLISPIADAKVSRIQFVDRNVLHGSRGLENRWIVTLTSAEACSYVINSGLPLFNKVVKIRSYDDTVGDEYEAFVKYTKQQKYLNPEGRKSRDT